VAACGSARRRSYFNAITQRAPSDQTTVGGGGAARFQTRAPNERLTDWQVIYSPVAARRPLCLLLMNFAFMNNFTHS